MERNRIITPSAPSSARTDLLSVVAAGLLWGTGGLAGALLTARSALDPLAVAGYRLAIGGGLVLAWLLLSGRAGALRFSRHGCRRLLVVALLAAWYQSCYFAAVSLTSVSLATLVTLGSAPVLVVAAESAIVRRLPTRRTMSAVAVAGVGLALLVGAPGESDAIVAGMLCALGSAGGFAALTMLGARPVRGLGALPTIGVAFSLGGLITLPVAALVGRVAVEVQVDAVALLGYLGLVPTALAYVLYFTGLRTVATGSAALLALLEPLTAAVLGAVVLSERLGVSGLCGAVLIGLAVLLTTTEPSPWHVGRT